MPEYLLEDWFISTYEFDARIPVEFIFKQACGKVYNHPKYEDGTNIHTSPLIWGNPEENGYVITKSGSKYHLGKMSPKYAAWVEENR